MIKRILYHNNEKKHMIELCRYCLCFWFQSVVLLRIEDKRAKDRPHTYSSNVY
jgi:hypothetical protein